MKYLILILYNFYYFNIINIIHGCCPNRCNGRGICTSLGNGCICNCFHGFMGGDCSLRECPKGNAWSDIAIGIDTAHQLTECSNRGLCDHTTGKCTCDPGFTGKSCNRKWCPNSCSGHGECRSMRYHATMKDLGTGSAVTYTSSWDSEMMFGCVCTSGYTGPDCSLRLCPTGDDPLTTGQSDEVQHLTCSATGGTFTLSFRGETTTPIEFDASNADISAALLSLSTIHGISIEFSQTADPPCSTNGNTIIATFTKDFGSLPLLVADTSSLTGGASSISISKQTEGTKENEPCSNRGSCDLTTGVCSCYTGYATSDGLGQPGDRGDCGDVTDTIATCPGSTICSGHGTCSNSPQYRCTCYDGWTSGDCSKRTCPLGHAWFDEASNDDVAHALLECSGKGLCVEESGVCSCDENYEGAACERMKCPGATPCNGHGTCLSMENLAKEATSNGVPQSYTYGATPNKPSTWDFNKIQGCLCDSGYTGHDCSLRKCSSGDNPRTINQNYETQTIVCTSSSTTTTFKLIFRGQQTSLIVASSSQSQLKDALENLSTIGQVVVSYSTGNSACTTNGSNKISIQFISDFGDLPALDKIITDVSLITGFVMENDGIGDSVKGTLENSPCSENGICDHVTGRCTCFDGMISNGLRNDCGSVMELQITTTD